MKYGKARELVESAIEAINEAVNAKDLRKKIDLHGNQVQVHSQLYNNTMDPEHRAQVNAHQEAHGNAVKAYKKATGKEYYGKVIKNTNPVYLKTTAAHRSARLSAAGQPGGMNW